MAWQHGSSAKPPTVQEVVPRPVACPFCRSSKITTTSESPDTSSYWRCEDCGDVWNADRLRGAPGWRIDTPRWR